MNCTTLSVNVRPCGHTCTRSLYRKWLFPQASCLCFTILLKITIPCNFTAWAVMPSIYWRITQCKFKDILLFAVDSPFSDQWNKVC